MHASLGLAMEPEEQAFMGCFVLPQNPAIFLYHTKNVLSPYLRHLEKSHFSYSHSHSLKDKPNLRPYMTNSKTKCIKEALSTPSLHTHTPGTENVKDWKKIWTHHSWLGLLCGSHRRSVLCALLLWSSFCNSTGAGLTGSL